MKILKVSRPKKNVTKWFAATRIEAPSVATNRIIKYSSLSPPCSLKYILGDYNNQRGDKENYSKQKQG